VWRLRRRCLWEGEEECPIPQEDHPTEKKAKTKLPDFIHARPKEGTTPCTEFSSVEKREKTKLLEGLREENREQTKEGNVEL